MLLIKKVSVLLAMLIGLAAPLVAIAPAEAAGTPGCVTRSEFSRVTKGMTYQRVTQIIGARGTQTWLDPAGQTREYRACIRPAMSFVGVVFAKRPGQPYKVYAKSSFFA